MSKIEVIYPKQKVKDKGSVLKGGGGLVMIGSGGGGDDGFLARVTLAEGVHLQLFPKYGLVAMEVSDNGNTNLPAQVGVEDLLNHLFDGEPPIDPGHPDAMDHNPKKPRDTAGAVYAACLDYKFSKQPLEREVVKAAIKKLIEVAKKDAAKWGLNF